MVPKQPIVLCPGEMKIVGAGALIKGGAGHVMIDGIAPGATLNALTVRANEDDNGYIGNWSLTGYAFCADPLPFGGLERRMASSSAGEDSSSPKTAKAGCTTGKKIIGMGGSIVSGEGEIVLDDLYTNLSLSEVTVRAYEDEDGYSDIWDLRAYAICAVP